MSSTEYFSLFFLFLSTGFTVGFGHCIGMCGPLVISFALHLRDRNRLLPHLLYNCGRILTYAVLGGIMGLTGTFTGVASEMAGLQKGVMVLAGLLIVLMGLGMGGWLPRRSGTLFADKDCGVSGNGMFSSVFRRLSRSRSPLPFFPLGMVLGLLPCGPVYTALLAVTRATMGMNHTGGMGHSVSSILTGAGLMTAFGIGTVPALLLVARLANMKWLRYRSLIYKTGAVMMIGIGILFTIRAFQY